MKLPTRAGPSYPSRGDELQSLLSRTPVWSDTPTSINRETKGVFMLLVHEVVLMQAPIRFSVHRRLRFVVVDM